MLAGAEIFVFEDSVKGLHSLRAAQGRLESLGVTVPAHLSGHSEEPYKRQGLEAAGALMFSDIEQVLRRSSALA